MTDFSFYCIFKKFHNVYGNGVCTKPFVLILALLCLPFVIIEVAGEYWFVSVCLSKCLHAQVYGFAPR